MKLTCIIVDDEPLAVKLLETYVKKTSGLELIASFSDSIEAINAIKSAPPNLLFLDIQMPDLNGMELAHMIPHNTRVVFTTAFKEYAFDSYEVNAMDFLLKPIKYSKFLITVERAMEWFGKTHATENNGHTVVIGSAVNYAPYVELGTGKFAEGGGGRPTPWVYQDSKGNWHRTSGMKPRPYLRPAIEEHKREYKEVIEQELKRD